MEAVVASSATTENYARAVDEDCEAGEETCPKPRSTILYDRSVRPSTMVTA
jgi:hypothetical protein